MTRTPGPLRYPEEPSREGAYHLRDTNGHRVGLAYSLADAKLWASAPDLLAACKAAESALRELDPTMDGARWVRLNAAVTGCRDAVAKAEG